MTKFVILIYESEADWRAADNATFREIMAEHDAFGAQYAAKIVGGDALRMTDAARTVRDSIVTDGPFLETKEALGGYYVVDVADIDEATEIAKHVPARFGCVEVRPTIVFDQA